MAIINRGHVTVYNGTECIPAVREDDSARPDEFVLEVELRLGAGQAHRRAALNTVNRSYFFGEPRETLLFLEYTETFRLGYLVLRARLARRPEGWNMATDGGRILDAVGRPPYEASDFARIFAED
jgi:hypothetical protein